MNLRGVPVLFSVVTLHAATAYAHSPDCYRDVGIGSLVQLVVAILFGAFWMERTFGARAGGAAPVLAWIAVVGVSLIVSLLMGGIGVIFFCS